MQILNGSLWMWVVVLLSVYEASAQVRRYEGKVSQQIVVNSQTPITDWASRKKIAYHEYEKLDRANPGKYHLDPIFDKYGKASSFWLKSRRTGQPSGTMTLNPDMMPEVGEVLPPFVMKGLDGVVYDSEKLKGKYILLGFWVRYEKPLYTLASTKVISAFVDEHRKRGVDIVSLGTTLNTREECLEAIPRKNCGFIPVPESYGFNYRYHIGETPFFILIDKQGIVKAMAPHTEFSTIGDLILK